MKQIIIFTIFLLASQTVESKDIQINPFQNTRISAKDCKKPGLNCGNCQTVLFCIEKGSGDFEYDYEVVNKCDLSAGMSCINGACSGKPNPECATETQVQFRCPEIGMFPDPYDCRTFHSCCSKGAVSKGNQCEKGYSYDPSSTYCKTVLKDDAPCPPATAISCTTPGQSGVTSNPTIYYVCTNVGDDNGNQVLYPKLHLCPNGKRFLTNKCQ